MIGSVGPGLFWIFALKYWSVAVKFELAMNEQDITSKTKLVNTLLIGGLVYLTILPLLSVILVLSDHKFTLKTFKQLVFFFLLPMFVSCLILGDAFRRMIRTKIQNNTISLGSVFILGLVFTAELVSITVSSIQITKLNVTNPDIKSLVGSFYAIQITFMIAFIIFGWILFNIIVSAAKSYNKEDDK